MNLRKPLAIAALLSLAASPSFASSTRYDFSGLYNTIYGGAFVSLAYTGSFSITDPAVTTVMPPTAADVSQPGYTAVWAGNSTFYTGAHDLQITFANSGTVSAAVLDTVVNNTTFAGAGTPYPLGESVQLYTHGGATLSAMSASMVCPDGSIDTVCDDSGVDPLYRRGDAADLALRSLTGVYFAFYNAPLSTVAAGVPDLADTFGAAGGGLGIYSINTLGQAVTTLTQFNSLSAVTTQTPPSPPTLNVPEPATSLLCLSGLAAALVRRKQTIRAD